MFTRFAGTTASAQEEGYFQYKLSAAASGTPLRFVQNLAPGGV